jgi:flavin-binding protein dodecin
MYKSNSVAKVTEIICSSSKSFDDAVENGIERASKSLKEITGALVADQKVTVSNGMIEEYRVVLKVTFVLAD